jgi:hypothetical protein
LQLANRTDSDNGFPGASRQDNCPSFSRVHPRVQRISLIVAKRGAWLEVRHGKQLKRFIYEIDVAILEVVYDICIM